MEESGTKHLSSTQNPFYQKQDISSKPSETNKSNKTLTYSEYIKAPCRLSDTSLAQKVTANGVPRVLMPVIDNLKKQNNELPFQESLKLLSLFPLWDIIKRDLLSSTVFNIVLRDIEHASKSLSQSAQTAQSHWESTNNGMELQ